MDFSFERESGLWSVGFLFWVLESEEDSGSGESDIDPDPESIHQSQSSAGTTNHRARIGSSHGTDLYGRSGQQGRASCRSGIVQERCSVDEFNGKHAEAD